jgi:hypothetical protein
MLSLSEFEKLVYEESIPKIIEKKGSSQFDILNGILPERVKTSSKEFFSSHRNRYVLMKISSFLPYCDKINLLFLNKFFRNNLKKILNESHYSSIQEKILYLFKNHNFDLNYLLTNNAHLLNSVTNIEENYNRTKDDTISAYYLAGIMLYKKYFEKIFSTLKENDFLISDKFNFYNLGLKENGFIYLIFTIARCSIIEELNLSENNISEDNLVYLKYAFKRPKKTKTLILEKNNFGGPIGISYFVEIFPKIKDITFLNLVSINMN